MKLKHIFSASFITVLLSLTMSVHAVAPLRIFDSSRLQYSLNIVSVEALTQQHSIIVDQMLQTENLAVNSQSGDFVQLDQSNQALLEVVSRMGHDDKTAQRAHHIAEATPLSEDEAYVMVAYAKRFNLSPSLILAVIDVESEFDQYSVGAAQDRGYMQIIPSTEKWLAETFGANINLTYDPTRIFEAEYQFGLAMTYLSFLDKSHDGDVHRMLSEYNRGPYNLAAYYKKHGTYQTSYSKKVISTIEKYAQFDN